MKLAIPVAFSKHNEPKPDRAVRSAMRSKLRLLKLTSRIVSDIQSVIDPDSSGSKAGESRERSEMTHLWDPELGPIPDGKNYAATAADEPF